jgi:hypothetical protein
MRYLYCIQYTAVGVVITVIATPMVVNRVSYSIIGACVEGGSVNTVGVSRSEIFLEK